jgi:D-alanine-D-alanine ligase
MEQKLKIAVLFGGTSSEREVSIASGAQVIKYLRERGHLVTAIDTAFGVLNEQESLGLLDKKIDSSLPSFIELDKLSDRLIFRILEEGLSNIDVAFLALHGGIGEDGTIQGILDILGVPYTGSGVLGSAVALDKEIAKRLFTWAGVSTPKWFTLRDKEIIDPQIINEELGWPVIIKPLLQGSTAGLSLVRDKNTLQEAITKGRAYGKELLIEQYIAGRELTVGVLDDKALTVGEIVIKSELFEYDAKYQPGMVHEIFPADLPIEVAEEAKSLAVKAHQALKLKGYSRSDFRLDNNGKLWCLEVNTLPGMTGTSLLPQSAKAAGIEFGELCERACRLAIS